jgi:putative oxidoreductase
MLHSFYTDRRSLALVPLRLIVGFGFLAHGVAKWSAGPARFGKLLHLIGAPTPVATAWAVILLEIFGGLAIIAGIYTELTALLFPANSQLISG